MPAQLRESPIIRGKNATKFIIRKNNAERNIKNRAKKLMEKLASKN